MDLFTYITNFSARHIPFVSIGNSIILLMLESIKQITFLKYLVTVEWVNRSISCVLS